MSKLVAMDVRKAEKMLRATGLLWAVNTLVLHPLGLALAFSFDDSESGKPDEEQVPQSIILMETDDGEAITFVPELIEAGRQKLATFLLDTFSKGKLPTNDGRLSHLAWPPPNLPQETRPARGAATVFLGDMVRFPMLDQCGSPDDLKKKHARFDEILHVKVPAWLYHALAAVEERAEPIALGKPLVIGETDAVLVVFKTPDPE